MGKAAVEMRNSPLLFSNRDITKMLIPLIFEQFLSIAVGMADSLMVATVSEAAISAVSLVDNMNYLMIQIFSALAIGGAVVAGQYIGKGDRAQACNAGQHMVLFQTAVSLLITAVLAIFRKNIISTAFGQIAPDVLEATTIYYRIVVFSIPGIALYNSGAALYRTMGKTSVTFKVSLLMNVINVVGNAFLLFVARIGVAGVAIPTLVSRWVAAFMILFLASNQENQIFLPSIFSFRLDSHLLKDVLSIGVPGAVENGMFHSGRVFLVSLISGFGTAHIAANAIGGTFCNFQIFVGQAYGFVITTIISQCIGKGNFEQARYYLRKLIKGSYLAVSTINVIILILLPLFLAIYNISLETRAYAQTIVTMHGIACITLWSLSFNMPAFLRATGDARFTMFIGVCTMWFIRVFFTYIIACHMGYGVIGVWFVQCFMDYAARGLLFTLRYKSGKWTTKAIKD